MWRIPMVKFLKNVSGAVLRISNPKEVLPVDYVWEIPMSDITSVMVSSEILAAVRNGKLQVGRTATDFFMDAVEGEAFLLTSFEGFTQIIEPGGTITETIPAIVSDIETGKKTTSLNYGILRILRELYNEGDNPIYKEGHVTIKDRLDSLENNLVDVDSEATLDQSTANIVMSWAEIADQTILANRDAAELAHSLANRAESIARTADSSEIDSEVTDIQTSISFLQNAESLAESEVKAVQSEMAYLQSNESVAAANIVDLQNTISNIQNIESIASSEMDVLRAENSGQQATIDNLQSQIGGLDPYSERGTERPDDVLFYYGWVNTFNSDVNGWDNEKVAQDMARYNIIILGAGVANSGHGDYANTVVIIPRIKELNPRAKIFGYVTVNQDLTSFQTQADEWDTLQVDGVFFDEAGYDYGKTRQECNDRVDYVHNLSSAKLCFVNAWNMDHTVGLINDPSFPNATFNSVLAESNLTKNDWYLLESFGVNTLSYTNDYEAKAAWFVRGTKAVAHRKNYGIKLASVGVISNDSAKAVDLFNFVMTGSMMFSLDAMGSSDENYGSSSAKVIMWERPDVTGLGRVWDIEPSVSEDSTDADAYIRFTDFGKLTVDFTVGAEGSDIVKN